MDLGSGHDFSVESGALLRVHQHAGDLDRSTPVGVVEALREDQLLQVPLLKLAVIEDDFVVVWNDGTLEGCLGNDEEVVVLAHDPVVDEGSRQHVPGVAALREEPLSVAQVHHHAGDAHLRNLIAVLQDLEVVFPQKVHLVLGNSIHEHDQLPGEGFVPSIVVLETFCSQLHHLHQLLVGVIEDAAGRCEKREGGVDGAAGREDSLAFAGRGINGQKSSFVELVVKSLFEGGHPEDVAPFGTHLQQDLGVDGLDSLLSESSFDDKLSDEFRVGGIAESMLFELRVRTLQMGRNHNKKNVDLVIALESLLHGGKDISFFGENALLKGDLDFDANVGSSFLKGFPHRLHISIRGVQDHHIQVMLAGKERLVEELEV